MRLNCYLCTAVPLRRSTAEEEGCVFWNVTAKKRRGIEVDSGIMGVILRVVVALTCTKKNKLKMKCKETRLL